MNSILQLRKKRGMQQKELALLVGVSGPTVSDWEHGKKNPTGNRLKKLCEIFNTSPSVILGYKDDTSPKTHEIRLTDEQISFALFGGADGVTKEDFEDVKRYAKFILAKKQGFGD